MLFDKNLVKSRQEAIGLILSGNVFIDSQRIDKPGTKVEMNCNLILKQKDKMWVSRGGFKLDKAINYFEVDCTGIIAMDIGSSTGGFTDVLIKKGAKKVYSVDVGYGQLDWNLRNNVRVKVLEKTNARYLDSDMISDKLDAIVCSAQEAKIVKKEFKKEIITPGIRFTSKKNDQKRILTPKQAIINGADWLVIGRDITKGNIKNNIQKLINHLDK